MKLRMFFVFYSSVIMSFAQNTTVKQYIDSFKNIAMKEMIEYKIPASITLAQGLLESGSGNSRLAKQGNNHFGIKCKKDWTGCTILEDDDALQECFRCYNKASDSYKDHSKFLRENKRYSALFALEISDYKAWARGLLSAGYATNQKYAELLINTIERNRLMQYDSLVLTGYDPDNIQPIENKATVINRVPTTIMGENQSLEDVAEANNKTVKKISKYNDLDNHRKIEPGDLVYLKPKRRKAAIASHQVENGETMWEISQKYAIKISSLYKKNLMLPGTEPKPGVVLSLQTRAVARPDTGRILEDKIELENTSEYHTVAKGETLYSIARIYGITLDELKKMNNLENNQISEGKRLIVKRNPNSQTKQHIVAQGETLYSIARFYSVTVDQIKTWNNLNSDSIQLGQSLVIK